MKRNIVIVCFKYPPVYSGYGKQLKLVVDRLLEETTEYNITLLTAYKESKQEERDRFVVKNFLDEYDENSKSIFPFARNVLKWLFINRKKYDMIHCVKAGPEAMACNLISKMFNKPLVIKIAQDELSDRELGNSIGIKLLTRKIRHWFLGTADNFIAISTEIENTIARKKSKNTKIHKIPNGVDTEKFLPIDKKERILLRKKLNVSENEIVLLHVGAINKRKGVYDLLNALDNFTPVYPFRCILCGPLLLDDKFQERIQDLNQRQNLILDYRGKVDNVDEFLKLTDIFILASYSEGLPNVLLEAGACGKPLIATDIGGSRDIVKNRENGIIIKTNSPSDIEKALDALLTNENLRMDYGGKAREIISSSFSLDKVVKEYINLYHELIEQRRTGSKIYGGQDDRK